MPIPSQYSEEAARFPAPLRALLEAELEAGNTIAESGSTFPAPPAGGFFRMTNPVTTHARASVGGVKYREFPNWINCGAFTDDSEFFFILEPPFPAVAETEAPKPQPASNDPASALGRFIRSMEIDYVKWHDGIGYDLNVIDAATPQEHSAIEAMLLDRGVRDWRDVEALAALHTSRSDAAVRAAMQHPDAEIRSAALRAAPDSANDPPRIASIVTALNSAQLFEGLSQALDDVADFHPKPVIDALVTGALHREGEAAVNFAAMLLFIHGEADSPFDWSQRPFFLRFHSEDRREREAAFVELCGRIAVDPGEFL